MNDQRDYHCRATVQGHSPGVHLARTLKARSARHAIDVMRTWMIGAGYRAASITVEGVDNPYDSAHWGDHDEPT